MQGVARGERKNPSVGDLGGEKSREHKEICGMKGRARGGGGGQWECIMKGSGKRIKYVIKMLVK